MESHKEHQTKHTSTACSDSMLQQVLDYGRLEHVYFQQHGASTARYSWYWYLFLPEMFKIEQLLAVKGNCRLPINIDI